MLMTALLLVLAVSGGLFFGILVYSGWHTPFIATGHGKNSSREGGWLADHFRRTA